MHAVIGGVSVDRLCWASQQGRLLCQGAAEKEAPVEIVLAVGPVDDLEEAFPVAPILHPQLLLHTVSKLAIAGSAPEHIHYPQVLLRDELHLCRRQHTCHIPCRRVSTRAACACIAARRSGGLVIDLAFLYITSSDMRARDQREMYCLESFPFEETDCQERPVISDTRAGGS